MKNRLEQSLRAMRAARRRGVLPYITAGDGGLDTTLEVLRALERAGAACVEIGLPFSDPIADGPVLQAASQRALALGTSFAGILELIAEFRRDSELPLVVLTYANPILAHGLGPACARLASAGADGLLVVDMPVEEGEELSRLALAEGLCPIFFASPTSSDERIAAAAALSRGFLYAIGRFGVTGAKTSLDSDALRFLARVRSTAGELPVAVGFGITTPEQVRAATASADLAIVGSALVEAIHRAVTASKQPSSAVAANAAEKFLRPLTEVLAR